MLAGSPPWPFQRGHATPLPLEASLAYGQAEITLGKGCNMIPYLPNSISEFRLAVTMPKLNFELRPQPKPGRNQNASYGRNRNQAETKKFGSFGAETVTEFRSDSSGDESK